MRPKITENAQPKKTEKESRKIYYKTNRQLIEELKKQPPGRVEELKDRGCGGRL